MLVSFWNSSNYRSGVTTNAASVALFYALRYRKRVALFENHLPGGIGLSDILVKKKEANSLFEEPMYYGKRSGLHEIYGQLKSGYPLRNISDSAIRLAGGKLHYYPQEDYGSHDLLDYELTKIIDSFMDVLCQYYDVVIADLRQYDTMSTKKIIERSDVVFLNLLPEEKGIRDFFYSHSHEKKQFYYVFSKLCKGDDFCAESILRKYSINPKQASLIPYNENFERTCRSGNLESFLHKNKWATLGQKPFEIIYEFRRMAGFIKSLADKEKDEKDEIISVEGE